MRAKVFVDYNARFEMCIILFDNIRAHRQEAILCIPRPHTLFEQK